MECDRATMFPFQAPPSPPNQTGVNEPPGKVRITADLLRDHVVKQSEKLGEAAGRLKLPGTVMHAFGSLSGRGGEPSRQFSPRARNMFRIHFLIGYVYVNIYSYVVRIETIRLTVRPFCASLVQRKWGARLSGA